MMRFSDKEKLEKIQKATNFNNDLFHSPLLYIKIEDSLWNIEESQLLVITMEKLSENIWKTVLKGDPEIDATKVDNSKPLQSFDPETQVDKSNQ